MMGDDMERAIGRVEGKLDSLIESLNRHFDDDERNFADVRTKINNLQKRVYWFSGAAAAVVAILTHIFKPHQ